MLNYLRKMRLKHDMTLDDVAKKVGATKAQISKLERGDIRINEYWLDILSKLYHCSVHDLIDDDTAEGENAVSAEATEKEPLEANSFRKNAINIPIRGFIDAKQAGIISYETNNTQALWVPMPQHVPALRIVPMAELSFFALSLRYGSCLDFKEGTSLIFVEITHKNLADELRNGTVIITSHKNNVDEESADFLRIIERDAHGFPYASYRIPHGRSSTTLSNTLLTGDSSFYELMEKQQKQGLGSSPKEMAELARQFKKIPLQNGEIGIRAFLLYALEEMSPPLEL